MSKNAASFVVYLGTASIAVGFTALMLWLAAPLFSLPVDRPPPQGQERSLSAENYADLMRMLRDKGVR